MGSGYWSATTYTERATTRARTGTDTFHYSHVAKQTGNLRVHQTLDPHGLVVRESRDSEEHPASNAIIIGLDVTGSMSRVVRGIHADLPRLHELLLAHRCVPDPQILFAAVGDATCDRVPLQVGQFESDNRMDQNLEHMILEGGGGGQKTESYELMLYTTARHTTIDCWEKRQRKGYLFMIGDEMAYPFVYRKHVTGLIDDGLQADVPLEQVIDEVRQRYHLYYIIPGGASHGRDDDVINFWCRRLGDEHVIRLDDPNDTSESIALTIGVSEGVVSPSQGVDHLRSKRGGVVSRTLDRLAQTLESIFGRAADTSGSAAAKRRL
jgi:hypothetical protein